jgi:hypothetical protein
MRIRAYNYTEEKSPFEVINFDYKVSDISTKEMLDFLKESRQ